MSCFTGFFNMQRGWQSLNTGPRFYLRLIRRTDWLWIYKSHTTDGRPFKPKKLSVPFLYPGVPAGLTPFRGLVPLGRRNLMPILPPAHPLWGGDDILLERFCKLVVGSQSSLDSCFTSIWNNLFTGFIILVFALKFIVILSCTCTPFLTVQLLSITLQK